MTFAHTLLLLARTRPNVGRLEKVGTEHNPPHLSNKLLTFVSFFFLFLSSLFEIFWWYLYRNVLFFEHICIFTHLYILLLYLLLLIISIPIKKSQITLNFFSFHKIFKKSSDLGKNPQTWHCFYQQNDELYALQQKSLRLSFQ